MKYPEKSWIPNSKEIGEWGDLNFGGWMLWWNICGSWRIHRRWMVVKDWQSWKRVLGEVEADRGL